MWLLDLQDTRSVQHVELVAGVRMRPRLHRRELHELRRRLSELQRNVRLIANRLQSLERLWRPRHLREQHLHVHDRLHG
jgi:hypothetical protein